MSQRDDSQGPTTKNAPARARPAVQRRDLVTALIGAGGLGAAASLLSGCASQTGDALDDDPLAQASQGLTGTKIVWVDTVLGSSPPAARTGDLATKGSAALGQAKVAIALGCVTAGDGGGGVFFWEPGVTTGDDGGTAIVPTVGGGRWRRVWSGPIDVMWFGAVADDSNDDTTALGMALAMASATGAEVYVPPARLNAYKVTAPLTLSWGGNGVAPLAARICGAGPASTLKGYGIGAGAAVLQLLGNGNGPAVDMALENLQIVQDATCHAASWCLRVGDANSGFLAERIWCQGANGVALRIASSASYAQINTVFRQCSFVTNAGHQWGAEGPGLELYAVAPESGGAAWDNVRFEACTFAGLVSTRATLVEFDDCQFSTHPARGQRFGCNAEVLIGSATFTSCYFEDHFAAIHVWPALADVHRVHIADCYFSGNSNHPGQVSSIGVWPVDAPNRSIGSLSIEHCVFGDELYAIASVQNAATLRSLSIVDAVNISAGVVVDAPIRISNDAVANFTLSTTAAREPKRAQVIRYRGTTTGYTLAYPTLDGSTKAYQHLLARKSWVGRISLTVDAAVPASSPELTVLLNRNGTTVLNVPYPSGFATRLDDPSGYVVGHALAPLGFVVFQPADKLQIVLYHADGLPPGTGFAVEVELAY